MVLVCYDKEKLVFSNNFDQKAKLLVRGCVGGLNEILESKPSTQYPYVLGYTTNSVKRFLLLVAPDQVIANCLSSIAYQTSIYQIDTSGYVWKCLSLQGDCAGGPIQYGKLVVQVFFTVLFSSLLSA